MDGSFACPDCGCLIRLTGVTPGRQIHCDWCQSLVEVPFLPRADQIKRLRGDRARRQKRRLPAWAWTSIVILAVAIIAAGASRLVRTRIRTAESDDLTRLLESSAESERCGKLGAALATLEGALLRARQIEPPLPNLQDLCHRRDVLSLKEAEMELAALSSGKSADTPGRAVGYALTLLERVHKDKALAKLEGVVRAEIDRLRLVWAEDDDRLSQEDYDAGKVESALELCSRQYRTAEQLSPSDRKRLQDDASALAQKIISRYGMIVEPVSGKFALGSATDLEALIRPIVIEACRRKGYLTCAPGALFQEIWTRHAPFRITIQIQERQDDRYLSSPNRLSYIDSTFLVMRNGQQIWRIVPNSQTQIPVPGLPAYMASRVAVSDKRSPDFERVLYENARAKLLERLESNLRNLPEVAPRSG